MKIKHAKKAAKVNMSPLISAYVTAGILAAIMLCLFIKLVPATFNACAAFARDARDTDAKQAIAQLESRINKPLTKDLRWANLYGVYALAQGKRETRGFDILKDNDGTLHIAYAPTEVLRGSGETLAGGTLSTDRANIEKARVDSLDAVYQLSKERGAAFLFLQISYKNFCGKDELNGYSTDTTIAIYDWYTKQYRERGIPVCDLRKLLPDERYYKTDLHWTNETAFDAVTLAIQALNERYGLGLDPGHYLSVKDNYRYVTYPDSFLGSEGVRVGKYYAGKDDFTIPIPKFPTDFTYRHFIDGKLKLEKSGDFSEAFIDFSILDNPSYNNKYNAILNCGYVENIIENHLDPDGVKMLFISASYGRPMAMYLASYCGELRYLDPSTGRYEDNYLTYIEAYDPDVVLVMYNNRIPVTDATPEK